MPMLFRGLCVMMDGTNKRTRVWRPDRPAKMMGRKGKKIMEREDNHPILGTSTGAAALVSRSRVMATMNPDLSMRIGIEKKARRG